MASASRALVEGILGLASEVGIDTAGLEPLKGPGRLPRDEYHELWRELQRRCQSGPVGLRLGGALKPGSFGLLDFAIRNAPTLQQVLYDFSRFLPVLYAGPEIQLKVEGDLATLFYVDSSGPRPAADWAVAAWKTLLGQLSSGACVVSSVGFQDPAPEDVSVYKDYFGCRVEFGHVHTGVEFDAATLSFVNENADARLYSLLADFVARENESTAQEESEDFVARVRRALEAEMAEGRPTRDGVAARLRMSGSTLQRQLKRHGQGSFAAYLDGVRSELAQRYLSESNIAVGELALQLGYSDTSNFVRAFRKWTGKTPGQFREAAASADAGGLSSD